MTLPTTSILFTATLLFGVLGAYRVGRRHGREMERLETDLARDRAAYRAAGAKALVDANTVARAVSVEVDRGMCVRRV